MSARTDTKVSDDLTHTFSESHHSRLAPMNTRQHYNLMVGEILHTEFPRHTQKVHRLEKGSLFVALKLKQEGKATVLELSQNLMRLWELGSNLPITMKTQY